jgi:hypothetical protein
MRKFLITAAILALGLPPVFANNDRAPSKPPAQASSSPQDTQNVETKDRKTLTAKGGLLNTETTPEQARKTAEATNRQILEKRRKR